MREKVTKLVKCERKRAKREDRAAPIKINGKIHSQTTQKP